MDLSVPALALVHLVQKHMAGVDGKTATLSSMFSSRDEYVVITSTKDMNRMSPGFI